MTQLPLPLELALKMYARLSFLSVFGKHQLRMLTIATKVFWLSVFSFQVSGFSHENVLCGYFSNITLLPSHSGPLLLTTDDFSLRIITTVSVPFYHVVCIPLLPCAFIPVRRVDVQFRSYPKLHIHPTLHCITSQFVYLVVLFRFQLSIHLLWFILDIFIHSIGKDSEYTRCCVFRLGVM